MKPTSVCRNHGCRGTGGSTSGSACLHGPSLGGVLSPLSEAGFRAMAAAASVQAPPPRVLSRPMTAAATSSGSTNSASVNSAIPPTAADALPARTRGCRRIVRRHHVTGSVLMSMSSSVAAVKPLPNVVFGAVASEPATADVFSAPSTLLACAYAISPGRPSGLQGAGFRTSGSAVTLKFGGGRL